VRLSRLAPRNRRMRMPVIIVVTLAVAACVGGDIGAPAGPLASRPADSALVALTRDAAPAATLPPGHIIVPIPPQQQISYTVGYANAQKLDSSALLGEPAPPMADLDITLFQTFELAIGSACVPTTGPECTTIVYSTAQLNYHNLPELPPFTATFLAYGFVPVTATITLTSEQSNCPAPQSANLDHTVAAGVCLLTIQHGQYPAGQETTVTASVTVHLSNLKVDGTPLDVGSRCQAGSAGLQVVGASSGNVSTPPAGQYIILAGGTLTGTVTIPAFTGCVTPSGENLDPLLSSAVSGPGNDVQLTQGGLCLVGSGCKPVPPVPDRSQGKVLLQNFSESIPHPTGNISCTSAGHATAVTAKPGTTGAIGAVGSFSLSGCTAQLNGATCSATGSGLPWPVNAAYYDPVAEQAVGTIGDSANPFDLVFTCKGPGASACSMELSSNAQTTNGAGSVNVIYDYRTKTITDFAAGLAPVSSDCPGFVVGSPPPLNDQDELFIPSYVVK